MKCHNCTIKYYTGEENTPLGKGYTASVNKKMRGQDKKMYVVKEYKNGKRWVRVTSGVRSSSPSPSRGGGGKKKTSRRGYDRNVDMLMTDKFQLYETDSGVINGKIMKVGDEYKGGHVEEFYYFNDVNCEANGTVVVYDGGLKQMFWENKPTSSIKCRDNYMKVFLLAFEYLDHGKEEKYHILKYISELYKIRKNEVI